MVLGSIFVDVISIIVASGKGGAFTTVLIPILEVLLKVGVVVICALDYFREKDSRYESMDRRQSRQNQ